MKRPIHRYLLRGPVSERPRRRRLLHAIALRLILLGVLSGLGCSPLIQINPETGQRPGDRQRPLCERVVERMIRCSTDSAFRERLRHSRDRAVAACRREGLADAKRCDAAKTCDAFVRCLSQ